ncbi:uncharacterized protein SPPG_02874 [Spizellomyces punctatus DAOM BR117]|uniref:Cytochrome b5 heme-binding domain-containing protein n=1 Tax=Spizellomyces punctatus (strain DAOM BR117) TaxID=645134 RepID=A0A0L0HMT5_SPIPD|nr:uncharacterized protein SPPG_02874 [Spizellomyces punctatus DAOM BR117]KND02407.1 hypothetical protein SPPG_02874 [Spizellomyces punctatus DAOM BR117]|eukprot:XP_016610446.1 hypothetical protein SPPG_02874 [Spizellomyces punctatus DAOM BR117]
MAVDQGPRQFTWEEIEKSIPPSGTRPTHLKAPAYMVINNKVYDLSTGFFSWHPGGAVAFSQLGRDASGAFQVFHRDHTHEILANFYAGDLAPSEIKKDSGFAQDVQQLLCLIEKNGWLVSSKAWYAVNMLGTLSMALVAAYLVLYHGQSLVAVCVSASLLALFWQQCGWLSHDVLHNQLFESHFLNDAVGYFFGNVCQGFSVSWWKHKHCTHHSVPNVHSGDPDIDTLPFLAWSEHALEGFSDVSDATLAKFLVTYQPILYFPLLCFARLNWALSSLMWALAPGVFPLRQGVEVGTLVLHWAWYLGLASRLGMGYALLWMGLSQAVCGVLLAAVFSVNHNGMPIYTPSETTSLNFYALSILTARNVSPTLFTNWFTGGLNHQIEHHMFPMVPRHHLPQLVPYVKDLCKKHGIEYCVMGLGEGLGQVVGRLGHVAGLVRKMHLQ